LPLPTTCTATLRPSGPSCRRPSLPIPPNTAYTPLFPSFIASIALLPLEITNLHRPHPQLFFALKAGLPLSSVLAKWPQSLAGLGFCSPLPCSPLPALPCTPHDTPTRSSPLCLCQLVVRLARCFVPYRRCCSHPIPALPRFQRRLAPLLVPFQEAASVPGALLRSRRRRRSRSRSHGSPLPVRLAIIHVSCSKPPPCLAAKLRLHYLACRP
ncbi:hypothetical protein B0H14DRAFT_3866594, partial [Mycena olivaceomarginata]